VQLKSCRQPYKKSAPRIAANLINIQTKAFPSIIARPWTAESPAMAAIISGPAPELGVPFTLH
jgi:hypothetical protein